MAGKSRRIKIGDKVLVQYGLGEYVCDVIEVYGPPPPHRYIRVLMPIHGPEYETIGEKDVTFPEDELRLLTAA